MIFLTAFLLTILAVNSFPFDSRDCFEHSEMGCMENFVDAVFYSNRGADECSELQKFVDCSSDAVDECFGDERNTKVDKGLEELENLSKDICGAISSGDNSDFDEETYSHFQLTATFKKKKMSHSKAERKTSISSHSKNCFGERKKFCWDTFENAVIHSVFSSSAGLDKCSVLRHFVLCSRQAADDCFGDEHDEDADEMLDVWENKSKEFCETDISDDKSVTVVVPSIREDQAKNEIKDILFKVLSEKYEGSSEASDIQNEAIINNTGLSHRPPRKDNCMIRELGSPILMRASNEVGAWFQDAMPTDETEGKYYATFASDTNHLYEYNSRDAFRRDARSAIYELPFPFIGTGHLVYNGSIYYHEAKLQMLSRFEFSKRTSVARQIADVSYNDEHYLYSSEIGYMDVMADENGLWVVYSAKDTNNTLVRKLHPYTLATQYMWNLTLPHRSVGEMFMACGVLYAIDSVTAPFTSIRFAFDLYQNKVLEVDIQFSNPFWGNSMIAYNPKHGKIFTWGKGHQYEFPILFGTIGQPEPNIG